MLAERSISITFAHDFDPDKISDDAAPCRTFLKSPIIMFLPYFAMMEQEELVTRAERVGILTTVKGSRKIIDSMREKYHRETEEILGASVFQEIIKKISPQ